MKYKILLGALMVLCLCSSVFRGSFDNFLMLVGKVYAIGTPDAYGNCIMNLTIHQWDGDSWEERLFWDNDTAWEVRVEPEYSINFTYIWRLNITLASDAAEARSYTNINGSIQAGVTVVWDNVIFNFTGSVTSDANYYYGFEQGHWNETASGRPQAGVTYNVNATYSGFF